MKNNACQIRFGNRHAKAYQLMPILAVTFKLLYSLSYCNFMRNERADLKPARLKKSIRHFYILTKIHSTLQGFAALEYPDSGSGLH